MDGEKNVTEVLASKSYPWGKAAAIFGGIIGLNMVYNLYIEYMDANCFHRGFVANSTDRYVIKDARWTTNGCKYLMKQIYSDDVTWWSQKTYDAIVHADQN
jgi:hypothetical protein